jgi:dTMP kinase
MLIAFEGADAAGKEMQSRLLAARLKKEGCKTKLYSFPQYAVEPMGPLLRRYFSGDLRFVDKEGKPSGDAPVVLQTLFFADRLVQGHDIAGMAASRDTYVICDRWIASAFAYGTAEGMTQENLLWLASLHDYLPKPDLTIYLEVSLEEARKRKPVPDDRYEADAELQEKVRAWYRAYYQEQLEDPVGLVVARVNGEGFIQDVHELVWEKLESALLFRRD